MKCIVKTKNLPGHLELLEKEVPNIGNKEILVKVLATAICGTDVHILDLDPWAEARIEAPITIGHEFVGEVIEIGESVSTIKVGDIISAESHIVCNLCEQCRNGNRHVCPNTKIIGVNVNGSFAEYITIPEENAFLCDFAGSIEIKSLMEPLGVAVHAMMEYPISGKNVVIVGCGPIGLMSVAIAKFVGATNIIAIEPNNFRRKLALQIGATFAINPLNEDPTRFINDNIGMSGVDIVVDFSGNVDAINKSLTYLKPEGKLVGVGIPAGRAEVNVSEFVYRGLTWKGISGRKMYKTWEIMRGLLDAGLDIQPVITHVLPLEKFTEGLNLMKSGLCGKVILIP